MTMRLLTLRDVTAITSLSRSAVYAMMAESRFQKPIRIGSRAVRWVEQEVLDFIASRPRGGSERTAASPGCTAIASGARNGLHGRPRRPDA